MSKVSELEQKVEDLERRGDAAEARLRNLSTIALTFDGGGVLASAASSTPGTSAGFKAQKAALEAALRQTDALLLQAVGREVREAAVAGTKKKEAENDGEPA